jgi:hypothetical protein
MERLSNVPMSIPHNYVWSQYDSMYNHSAIFLDFDII